MEEGRGVKNHADAVKYKKINGTYKNNWSVLRMQLKALFKVFVRSKKFPFVYVAIKSFHIIP